MSLDEFFNLSPQEINWKILAYNEEIERQRKDGYNLAVLMGYAYHDPKKMPKFEKVYPKAINQNQAPASENEERVLKERLKKRNFIIHS